MGTSCLIGIRHDDKIYSFRVNYNGYLTGVGQLLLDNFDTEEKVDELVKCGEICSLEPSIKDIKNHEIEYYEWHKNLKKKDYDIDEIMDNSLDIFTKRVYNNKCKHYYLMDNGVWYYGNVYTGEKLKSLLKAIQEEKSRSI